MRFLAPYQSTILSLVRIASAYMFILHGTTKAFGFPSAPQYPLEWMSIFGAAAALELVGGALLLLGLFTRPVAFILSGQMAVAYFMFHAGAAAIPPKTSCARRCQLAGMSQVCATALSISGL